MDLVGPISPLSREGHKYFLTIVDSCTRFCSAIPIKHKSDVSEVIAQAIGLEAKRIGYYPTMIHSDWSTEFINSHLLEFCTKSLFERDSQTQILLSKMALPNILIKPSLNQLAPFFVIQD